MVPHLELLGNKRMKDIKNIDSRSGWDYVGQGLEEYEARQKSGEDDLIKHEI